MRLPRLDEARRAAIRFPGRWGRDGGHRRGPRPLLVHVLPGAAPFAFGAGLDAQDVHAAVGDALPLRAALTWRPGRVAIGAGAGLEAVDPRPDPMAVDVVVTRVVPARGPRRA